MMIDAPAVQEAPQPSGPVSYDSQYEKARALASAGQHELAIAAYTALLAQSPNSADVLLGRGLSHARLQRYADAERDLKAAAVAAPAYADVWSSLGNVYVWSDRPALAVPAYGELIKLQPADPAHRIARASAYRDLGQRALARADLAEARRLGGDQARIAALSAALAEPVPGVTRAAGVPGPELSVPVGYTWSAGMGLAYTRLSLREQRWNEQNVSVRRYFAKGSLGVETMSASRFDQRDTAWALDGYASLWDGAYANLRYQKGPSERLFPSYAWRAELFQSVGKGWELSVSDDRMNFGGSRVDIYGLGVARYVGDFYIRLRHTNVKSAFSSSSGDRLVVRYYYAGNGDDYVEAAAARGRSDDPLSLAGGRQQSGGASVSYVKYPTPQWGYKVGLSYARESDVGSERGLTGSLFMRW